MASAGAPPSCASGGGARRERGREIPRPREILEKRRGGRGAECTPASGEPGSPPAGGAVALVAGRHLKAKGGLRAAGAGGQGTRERPGGRAPELLLTPLDPTSPGGPSPVRQKEGRGAS